MPPRRAHITTGGEAKPGSIRGPSGQEPGQAHDFDQLDDRLGLPTPERMAPFPLQNGQSAWRSTTFMEDLGRGGQLDPVSD